MAVTRGGLLRVLRGRYGQWSAHPLQRAYVPVFFAADGQDVSLEPIGSGLRICVAELRWIQVALGHHGDGGLICRPRAVVGDVAVEDLQGLVSSGVGPFGLKSCTGGVLMIWTEAYPDAS